MFLSPPQSAASLAMCCMAVLQALLSESAFNQGLLNQAVTQINTGIRHRPSGLLPILCNLGIAPL